MLLATKYLSVFCLALLFFFSCVDKDISTPNVLSENKSCLVEDCVTATNQNIIAEYDLGKSEPINSIVRNKFSSFWSHPIMSQKSLDYGLPAWSLANIHNLSETNVSYYYLPLFHSTSSEVEAIMLITEYKDNYTHLFQLIEKDDISNYPFKSSIDEAEIRNTFQTRINMLAAAQVYVDFNEEIFGYNSDAIVATLPIAVQEDLIRKDVICRVTTYVVTSCQEVRGGQNQEFFISLDCSHSYETVNTCDRTGAINGGGPSGGSSSGPSTGNTGSNTGGSVTTVLNNRCEEDGVGCDDIEDENINTDCISFEYVPHNNVQVAAVRDISLHYFHAQITTGYTGAVNQFYWFDNLYFEFSPYVTPGFAATRTAEMVDAALDEIEDFYGLSYPEEDIFREDFLIVMNRLLGPWGGRVTETNNYGPSLPVNPYVSRYFGNGNCND